MHCFEHNGCLDSCVAHFRGDSGNLPRQVLVHLSRVIARWVLSAVKGNQFVRTKDTRVKDFKRHLELAPVSECVYEVLVALVEVHGGSNMEDNLL